MPVPSTPINLSAASQKHILDYYIRCHTDFYLDYSLRDRWEAADRAYQREMAETPEDVQAEIAAINKDPTKFRNIIVPVVMPQVEAATVYQASVFLTGHPIFQAVASPEYQEEATAITAKIEEDSIMGGWVSHFIQHFRNGFKYNLAALHVPWEVEKVPSFSTLVTEEDPNAVAVQENLYEGNCVQNLDLYNTLWDSRVAACDVAKKGEFAGFTCIYPRVSLQMLMDALPTVINRKQALNAPHGNLILDYYVPRINETTFATYNAHTGGMDWLDYASATSPNKQQPLQYKGSYQLTTFYARIVPEDFGMTGVANAENVQVWKFLIVNHSVLIYAERQTNAHNLIPILFSQPYTDNLDYQTKSLAEHAQPFQEVSSALWNSAIQARRRAIADRGLYDPSRVDKKHIENASATAKIPVKPSAYGKPLNEAYYPIPFNDNTSSAGIQEAAQVWNMADRATGRNQAQQGQFVKGNKTLREFDTVMGNANGKDQITSLHLEAQLFTPLKNIIKYNILQYLGITQIYDRDAQQMIEVDPVKLRKAVVGFKMADGLLPVDKLISGDALQVAFQTLAQAPQIAAGYNLAPLFTYMLSTQNASIKAFEKSQEQQAYEQALQAWVAAQGQGEQPKPQDYGYNPGETNAASAASTPQ